MTMTLAKNMRTVKQGRQKRDAMKRVDSYAVTVLKPCCRPLSRQKSLTYRDILGLGGSSLAAFRRPDLLPTGVHQHQLSLAT